VTLFTEAGIDAMAFHIPSSPLIPLTRYTPPESGFAVYMVNLTPESGLSVLSFAERLISTLRVVAQLKVGERFNWLMEVESELSLVVLWHPVKHRSVTIQTRMTLNK
jgi:hypothetical protein